MQPMTNQKLSGEVARDLAYALMNQRQREEFARDLECNFAISLPDVARFRVNVFMQQQNVGMVVRTIVNEIPNFAKLGLPDTLKDIVMTKRGLVLVVGATGSGKSTSLAAMIDHRNRILGRPHRHGGGSGRVRAPVAAIAHHSSRSRYRHAFLAQRAQEHLAPGTRRDPDRRDPRYRDHGARDRICRDRPPVPGNAAFEQRQPDHRPHHQFLLRGAAQAAAHGSLQQSAGDHLAAPDPHRRRQGPPRRHRDPHQYAHRGRQAARRASSTKSRASCRNRASSA